MSKRKVSKQSTIDYGAGGTLQGIGTGLSTVSPFLNFIPGFGQVASLIGSGLGAGLNAIGGIVDKNEAEREAAHQAQLQAMLGTPGSTFARGGRLRQYNGGVPGEQDSIQLGNIANVNQGETEYNRIVMSNKVKPSRSQLKAAGLPEKWAKQDFASLSKRIEAKYKRGGDLLEAQAKDMELGRLSALQDLVSQRMENLKCGGKLKRQDGGTLDPLTQLKPKFTGLPGIPAPTMLESNVYGTSNIVNTIKGGFTIPKDVWPYAISGALSNIGNLYDLFRKRREQVNFPMVAPTKIDLSSERSAVNRATQLARGNMGRAARGSRNALEYMNAYNTGLSSILGEAGDRLGQSYMRQAVANAESAQRTAEVNQQARINEILQNSAITEENRARIASALGGIGTNTSAAMRDYRAYLQQERLLPLLLATQNYSGTQLSNKDWDLLFKSKTETY